MVKIYRKQAHLYNSFKTMQVSYPNFVRGPLFVGMRPSLDNLKMFNTHRCVIRKVSQHSRSQNKYFCAIRKDPQHSRSQKEHCCIIRKVPQHSGGQKEYRCVIRKVSRCFEKKPVKKTKMGVYLENWDVCK